mmetsp:Transcript_15345/g.26412  ORF Transcript_15345/g.26412 Transcript_15345/m.26412 type:complete len:889 (-) Transcript_15345:74-2740(-)
MSKQPEKAKPAASSSASSSSSSKPAPAAGKKDASSSSKPKALFEVTPDPSKVPLHERIIVDSESLNKHKSIIDTFDDLGYGPAPESQAGVDAWLEEHNRKIGHFIGNKWVHPEGRRYRKSLCPGTMEVMCETIDGNSDDVNLAVSTAREAFKSWSTLAPHERAKHLYSIARHVQKHHRLLACVEALDNGKSIRETRDSDIPLVARHFYHHAGWAQLMPTEMRGWKPLGVIAEIVPWNFPLMLFAWKVCPALAMGNTVVVKPASYTRLSCLLFAEICAEAGLPPGVLNVCLGSGALGSMLADHDDVDKVAFTGSTPIGRVLRRRIAGSGKKISLELGGKSPVVVFETADLDAACEGVVDAIWFNQGQVCSAGSRLLVHESVSERFLNKLKRRIDTFRIGHPLDKGIDMGALVDESQYKTIKGFVDRAVEEGADVYVARVPCPNNGWYWPPTIVSNVGPTSECVAQEIFGPVLAMQTFRSPEEAIALANNTFFGLAGSVWTENISLALEVAISIKAGAIWVNAHNLFDAAAGFGGYRESGFGRDGGKEGLYEYVKPAWQPRARPSLTFPTEKPTWPDSTPARPAAVGAKQQKPVYKGAGIGVDRTYKVYIGGKQKRPDGHYSRPIYTPDGALISEAADGNRKDLRDAVEAAHKAAGGWGRRAAHNRAQICYFIAENLMARYDEFAQRLVDQTGVSLENAQKEVDMSVQRLFHYAAYADKYGGKVQETTLYGLTAQINEPVGAIGIVCPDEQPLLSFVSLIAPALVRANTIVVVPSEKHPLSATDLYQVFDTSDLPGGVVNIVTGDRETLTKTLVEHDDLQAVWYFGSEQGSLNVEYAASENMKRTWVNYGLKRDWFDADQGQGEEFLLQAVECKNVWVPMGECKASSGGY